MIFVAPCSMTILPLHNLKSYPPEQTVTNDLHHLSPRNQVKKFAMDILKRSSKTWVSEVLGNLDTMWDTIESNISKSGSASYIVPLQKFIFKFLTKSLVGADPSSSPDIAESGYIMLDRWLALQLLPTVKIGILQPLEEIFLHSWAYPFLLVSGDYRKLYEFVRKEGNVSLAGSINLNSKSLERYLVCFSSWKIAFLNLIHFIECLKLKNI